MKEMNISSKIRIKKYKSYKGLVGKIAPNILNRNFNSMKPNEKWATDITEFHLLNQKVYLSTIIDLYNGEIVCYNIGRSQTFWLVEETLKKAKSRMKQSKNLLLHSDQGWHYQQKAYQEFLKEYGITQSMSRKGNCLDNSVQENFFGHLKSEFFKLEKFENVNIFIKELEEYIDYYNNDRIKVKLKMSPMQYRTHLHNAA